MKNITFFFILCCIGWNINAQTTDSYSADLRASWLQKSEACKPKLIEAIKKPLRLVTLVKDTAAFQGWKAVEAGEMESLYTTALKKKTTVVVDFGEHLTGYFSCSLDLAGKKDSDAPTRLKFTFGEVPAELATPFDPYPGTLSRAWLQDEIVTVDYIPNEISLARRVSFRYLKIEILGAASFDFKISDMKFKAVSAASNTPDPLGNSTPDIIKSIDRVGLNTLRECMQTVYEDGPKRDLRLWIGDLYLEALANTYSFKNHELTKRCLYMLAGVAAPNGFLHATAFEYPKPHPQTGQHILDYALLYNTTLLDYLKTTKDMETALDLWPVAAKQIEIAMTYLDENKMYDHRKNVWIFFDWKEGLDRDASLIGLYVKTFKDTYELSRMLGKEKEMADMPKIIQELTKVARKNFFDPKQGIFFSGPNKQISYSSQIWMVLGGILNQKEGQKALKTVLSMKEAIYPGSPYGTHYLIEAMITCGMKQEAKDYLIKYWGGMVIKGADTFWEVYDPKNEFLSPYHFFPINSYCHAWSCTPVYFIRKYPEIFQ